MEDPELEAIRARMKEEMLEAARRNSHNAAEHTVKGSDMMSGDTIEITDANFEETKAAHGALVMDCWAPWCGPCRMIGPIIEELAKDYNGKVAFGKLNVDDNQAVARKFGIMSIPTILFFKDGEVVDKVVGAVPKQHLEAAIQKNY